MRKRFLTNLSLWLLFIFWIAIYELPPKQHRNARPPRGVESPRTKHVFLQLCLTTQLYIQPYSKKSFTNREEERVQISGWGVDHQKCHHTSHNCFLVTSVTQTITFLAQETHAHLKFVHVWNFKLKFHNFDSVVRRLAVHRWFVQGYQV